MRHVVAFGAFDLIHPGHLAFLRSARKLGDHLTVVVTRDTRLKREKGGAPIFPEGERLQLIAELKSVDRAVLGESSGKWTLLRRLRPDIIALGHDQDVTHPKIDAQIRTLTPIPKIVTIRRFGSHHHTSTRIKKRIYDRRKTSTRKSR